MYRQSKYKKILLKFKNILTYGENKKADYQILNIRYKKDYTVFDLKYKNIKQVNKKIKNIQLKLMGKHNVLNAAAALAICLNLGVDQNIIKRSLKKFSGVQRRMTKIFSKNNNDFYDDYAHPTEKNQFEGVKKAHKDEKLYLFLNLIVIQELFLKKEFAKSFLNSNLVLLCPLYAAGEKRNSNYNIMILQN